MDMEKMRNYITEFRERPFDKAASVVALNLSGYSILLLLGKSLLSLPAEMDATRKIVSLGLGVGGSYLFYKLFNRIYYEANEREFKVENELLFIGRRFSR